jgi:hypothetical protein
MKVTPKFVEIYSETFKFIDELGGKEVVEKYWKRIGPIILSDLRNQTENEGLWGVLDYWEEVLCNEGAYFKIDACPDYIKLYIDICPSMSHLKDPYHNYCGHCDTMYRQLFESLGYEYNIEKTGDASCHITVSKSSQQTK